MLTGPMAAVMVAPWIAVAVMGLREDQHPDVTLIGFMAITVDLIVLLVGA
ncbi:MAG: hypothetical protein R3324_22230 [Halobacteriales archaeon]|nr:hypothetical protein [Halobacteriales archaeon]